MSLGEHLQELRYRLVLSLAVIVVVAVVAAFFYDSLLQLMARPWELAVAEITRSRPDLDPNLIYSGVSSPFTLALKVVVVAALVVSSPFWLYQIWAFIVPALLPHEKRWALVFVTVATPLFLAGVVAGYWIAPKGVAFLLEFTPERLDVTNLVDMPYFLGVLIQLMLLFGVGFLIPVFTVVLNLAGVVPATTMAKYRAYVVFGCFVFAAVATPSGDPVSMLALGIPMGLLFVVAEVIAHINDRRRGKAIGDH